MASKEFCRPDPDQLLRRIQTEESGAARGRLKIFLGYAPRVGKSMRMFEEGLRRMQRGQDVVAGAIQLSGSRELEDVMHKIECVPPLRVGDGESMDVDAILGRAPQVCLIDELARENPAGSRHANRWQDVEELRAAGVNVVGAINLQYVCEQQDAVERITGKRAANSVPAAFIKSADELVMVDVPAEDVSKHSQRGSLQPEQLSQLRELALLFAAEVVEEQLQRYMEEHGIRQSWGTQERILVCITPRSSARAMLDSAARATQRFHGQMFVVYVKQPDLLREQEETLEANLRYARQLGAEVRLLEGADPIATILAFAREERMTQLFIGHTQRAKWKFWTPAPVDRLIAAAEGMDVRLFPQTAAT